MKRRILVNFNRPMFLLLLVPAFYLYCDNNVITRKMNIVETTGSEQSCDLFSGKWIFDESHRQFYEDNDCPFVGEEFSCQTFGRPDSKYLQWRWKPNSCDLPSFDGRALLEKLRGKKLFFVGDSLNRNQWKSMLCMINPYLSASSNRDLRFRGNLNYFHDEEYDATIGFYWSPFLVESNCDSPIQHRVDDRVVRINAIDKHARHWNDADYLVFDTHIWWLPATITLMWGSFENPKNAIYRTVEMKRRRYEMALNTWAEWVEMNVNRTKTKLYFTGSLPFIHDNGCYNRTEPDFGESGWRNHSNMITLQSTVNQLSERGVKVEILRITELSESRVDARPSVYFGVPGLKRKKWIDCVHWCLPGVPDIWNQILYQYIVKS